jgi:hypothetical protein
MQIANSSTNVTTKVTFSTVFKRTCRLRLYQFHHTAVHGGVIMDKLLVAVVSFCLFLGVPTHQSRKCLNFTSLICGRAHIETQPTQGRAAHISAILTLDCQRQLGGTAGQHSGQSRHCSLRNTKSSYSPMCAHTASRSVSRSASRCPALPCTASASVGMCARPQRREKVGILTAREWAWGFVRLPLQIWRFPTSTLSHKSWELSQYNPIRNFHLIPGWCITILPAMIRSRNFCPTVTENTKLHNIMLPVSVERWVLRNLVV